VWTVFICFASLVLCISFLTFLFWIVICCCKSDYERI
jgi:hypothetical protein